ncbi:tyrosine-type recombinase/integrase [Streptosporangium amethystogenes]|uniref:tyrosine-type recombinase/integrase n=1 Tax=Streptosporangium amethystogenes TaxID=2002 RepID=UPI0037970249
MKVFHLHSTHSASRRTHDLRHTCVALPLNLGVPPQVIRDIVDHSDIEVTMTIYAHVSLDDKRNALGGHRTYTNKASQRSLRDASLPTPVNSTTFRNGDAWSALVPHRAAMCVVPAAGPCAPPGWHPHRCPNRTRPHRA